MLHDRSAHAPSPSAYTSNASPPSALVVVRGGRLGVCSISYGMAVAFVSVVGSAIVVAAAAAATTNFVVAAATIATAAATATATAT
jgi:hypothetical protein